MVLDLRFDADRVLRIRQAHKMTQEQLAERLGVTQANVSQWERGARTPTDVKALTGLLALEAEL